MPFLFCLQLVGVVITFIVVAVVVVLFHFILFYSLDTTTVIFEESIFVSLDDGKARAIQAFDEAWKNATHVQRRFPKIMFNWAEILWSKRSNISDVNSVFVMVFFYLVQNIVMHC